MAKVLILLSTYNGEKYLPEQLNSLYGQEGVECHLLVRDDGSNDDTLKILHEYKVRLGNLTIVRGENLGAGGSFFALINEAAKNHSGYDYYAFSDQDDVWFPTKLATGVKALEESRKDRKFYYCGSINTDANLQPIASSSIKLVNSFGANLVANHILGCCMMFNGTLLHDINTINTKQYTLPNGQLPLHDAWAAFVAYILDADVIQDSSELMYYRQHGCNVIGSGNGFWSVQRHRITRYISGSTHRKSNKCIIALQVLGAVIPDKNRQLLELVATYRDSFRSKMRLMGDMRMYEYGVIDNVGTFLTLLFNKF